MAELALGDGAVPLGVPQLENLRRIECVELQQPPHLDLHPTYTRRVCGAAGSAHTARQRGLRSKGQHTAREKRAVESERTT
eukprot:1028445-Prymnesium_polylepis.1